MQEFITFRVGFYAEVHNLHGLGYAEVHDLYMQKFMPLLQRFITLQWFYAEGHVVQILNPNPRTGDGRAFGAGGPNHSAEGFMLWG